MAKCFNDSDRDAVYRAIHERRDMRHFVRDPVDPAGGVEPRQHDGVQPVGAL